MQVVADIEETFLPLPDDLLVNLEGSRAVVDALLDSLPQMFAGNHMVRSLARFASVTDCIWHCAIPSHSMASTASA